MNVSWGDLLTGLALMLVLEGLLPFLNPRQFRLSLITAAQLSDRALRLLGFGCLMFGLLALYWVRA